MAFLQLQDMEWHKGELEMQEQMRAPHDDNPTVPALSPQLAHHLQIAPLVAVGTLDASKRPWTTLWGGEEGLGQPVARDIIGIRTNVAAKYDPVNEILFGTSCEIIKEEGRGRMVSGVTIDLEARKRVKYFGRMIAGAMSSTEEAGVVTAQVQLVIKVEQSLGNCPKYLNKKQIILAESRPVLQSEGPELTSEALELISKSDIFFVSSSHNDEDMDTNHRGGPPGFVRAQGNALYWPEYSGNRLYQTLGNLKINPLAGIAIPDLETGDMLYITGKTEILVGIEAAKVLPKTNLAVKFIIDEARHVRQALPFRGLTGDQSPYNPKVRYLSMERDQPEIQEKQAVATLLKQEVITSTISRYRFRLDEAAIYKPGQYVTMDLSSLLDMGYSHMRNDDPRSLNDDFVRTFTVSSAPEGNEFEITIRHVGVVTKHMSKYKGTDYEDRQRLEVNVRGFGGAFEIVQKHNESIYFIAAGIGITPLLSSLSTLDSSRLQLLWMLRAADLPLVKDTFARYPALLNCATLFITGGRDGEVYELGVPTFTRRLSPDDLATIMANTRTYICTPLPLRRQLTNWLPDIDLIYEDFDY